MKSLIEDNAMTLMRVRHAAQLTLPADVRRALNVKEGDYLEARVVEGGVLLKPVAVLADEKKRAWDRIEAAMARVVDREANPDENNQAEEEAIAAEVKELRKKHD